MVARGRTVTVPPPFVFPLARLYYANKLSLQCNDERETGKQ